MFRCLAFAAVLTSLAACGDGAGERAAANGSGASPRSDNGQVTVRAEGVDLKINVPRPLRREMGMTDNSDLLYPGATLGGVHVDGGGEGRVALGFRSDAAPAVIALWYRDPARRRRFSIANERRDGTAVVLTGREADGTGLEVRLTPGGGGTEGTVTLSGRD